MHTMVRSHRMVKEINSNLTLNGYIILKIASLCYPAFLLHFPVSKLQHACIPLICLSLPFFLSKLYSY